MELQHTLISKADKLEVVIPTPGLNKDNITITFDKKEGTLEVMGAPEESEITKVMDLEISGKVTVSPKFRSDKPTAKTEDGITVISFGLAKEVSQIKVD